MPIGIVLFTTGVGSTTFSISVAPDFIEEQVSQSSGNTNSVTATPTGATGSVTYAWTILNNSGGVIGINSPTNSTTSFSYTGLGGLGETAEATVQCLATDSLSNTAFQNISVFVLRSS